MDISIRNEISRWLDRVIYDVRFKDSTKANLERLTQMFNYSMAHFVTIAVSSEVLVYKVGRYMIESGQCKCDDIAIFDGYIVESYIGDDAAEWRKKDRIDDMFKIFGHEFYNKWVLVPMMQFSTSVGIATYLLSQFRGCGALGLVFYAESPDNLAEVLAKDVRDEWYFEFPKVIYRKQRRKLVDDEW